jgi:hypothetical protein
LVPRSQIGDKALSIRVVVLGLGDGKDAVVDDACGPRTELHDTVGEQSTDEGRVLLDADAGHTWLGAGLPYSLQILGITGAGRNAGGPALEVVALVGGEEVHNRHPCRQPVLGEC